MNDRANISENSDSPATEKVTEIIPKNDVQESRSEIPQIVTENVIITSEKSTTVSEIIPEPSTTMKPLPIESSTLTLPSTAIPSTTSQKSVPTKATEIKNPKAISNSGINQLDQIDFLVPIYSSDI